MDVGVVGGGLAGLTAALELADRGHLVTVLEARARFGGQIGTGHHDGFVVEQGAEGFAARSSAVPELCRRVGLGAGLIAQTRHRALAWRDGALVELEDGEAAALLGIPVEAADLGRGLLTLPGGMGDLIAALVQSLEGRADLRTGARVSALLHQPEEERAWRLDGAGGKRRTHLAVEGVILAIPPRAARTLLKPALGSGSLPPKMRFGSTVAVTLAYPRDAVTHSLDATGFVVEGPGQDGLRAGTFSSSKFPGRAPAGWCLLRVFLTPEPGLTTTSADTWCERAHRLLTPILGLTRRPRAGWVSRWRAALPRPAPGHAAAVAGWRRRLSRYAAIECAGAALDGGGIDGAVRSGLTAAARLVAPARQTGEP
ncbi:MAG TPA: FAD-dependent oxidoreductase [Gemmatimonadales bacterium]|jgi:protoporphyrinogen oxidase|nr:FAD-dependent oxidoreductase [Gemmatimonadales bacterium]